LLEIRDRLAPLAERWDRSDPHDKTQLLLTGLPLAEGKLLAKSWTLTPLLAGFIRTSAKRSRIIHLRVGAAIVAVIAALAILSGLALRSARNADLARRLSDRTAYASLVNVAASDYESGNAHAALVDLERARAVIKEDPKLPFEWLYQYRRLTNYERLTKLKEGAVNTLALAPDGQRLAYSSVSPFKPSQDNEVILARTSDFSVIARFRAHQDGVSALAFSEDSKWLLTGGLNDGAIKLWDPTTGRLVWTTPNESRPSRVHKVAFAPNQNLVAAYIEPRTARSDALLHPLNMYFTHQLRFFDRNSGAALGSLAFDLRDFAISPSGALTAVTGNGAAASSRAVAVFPTGPGSRPRITIPLSEQISALLFADENTLVAVGQEIHVLDVATGKISREMRNGKGENVSVILMSQSLLPSDHAGVLVANSDGSVSAFDIDSGVLLGEVRTGAGSLNIAAGSATSGLVLFEDGVGWINRTYSESILRKPLAPCSSIEISADQRTVIVWDDYPSYKVGSEGGAHIVDLKLGSSLWRQPDFGEEFYLSSRGTELLVVNGTTVRAAKLNQVIFDLDPSWTYTKVGKLAAVSEDRTRGLLVSTPRVTEQTAQDHNPFSGSDDLMAELFDLETGQTISRAPIGHGNATTVKGALSPSADVAILVLTPESRTDEDNRFRLRVLVADGSLLRLAQSEYLQFQLGSLVSKVHFISSDDALLVDRESILVHLRKAGHKWQQEKWSTEAVQGRVSLVAPGLRGQGVVIGSDRGELTVVDYLGKEIRVRHISGHQAAITAAWLDLATSRVVTGDEDGFLKVWDLELGMELFSTRIDTRRVEKIALSPNGEALLASVASEEGRQTYLLDADSSQVERSTGNNEPRVNIPAIRMELLHGDYQHAEALLRKAADAHQLTPYELETDLARSRLVRAGTFVDRAQPLLAEANRLIFATKPPQIDHGIRLLNQAAELFNQAARWTPTIKSPNPAVVIPLSAALHFKGDDADAERLLRKAIQANPRPANLYDKLGFVLLALGRVDAAAEAFSQSAGRDESQAAPYGGLALVHLRKGQIAEARAAALHAVQIDYQYQQANFLIEKMLWPRRDADDFTKLVGEAPTH
jgi:WD40 repeat protein